MTMISSRVAEQKIWYNAVKIKEEKMALSKGHSYNFARGLDIFRSLCHTIVSRGAPLITEWLPVFGKVVLPGDFSFISIHPEDNRGRELIFLVI